ncbi:MAG: histidine kinase [Paucibacter sp.]|nr:histidine kinase [Roseateles sp.]
MPPIPTPSTSRFDRRELLIAAGLSLVLAAGMFLPAALTCHFGDCSSGDHPRLRDWLGRSGWIWCLWLAATMSQPWLPESPEQRSYGLGLQILTLTLLCPALGTLLGQTRGSMLPHNPYDLQVQASFAAVACLGAEYRQRRRRGEADAASLSQNAPMLARQLDEARMALLQAQVEPHFLFNTLAHLRRLARLDPQAARAMLADLRLYLAAALPELRQTEVPLERELALVRAFLALHQRRIGPDRLSLSFDIAPGLEQLVVPATCLLTLAENAVKHGITPQVAGGEISVRAGPDPQQPGLLRLEVADTGVGMGESSGGGTGLVTLRSRIAALHGPAARLSLHLNQPRGLIARLQLPWP